MFKLLLFLAVVTLASAQNDDLEETYSDSLLADEDQEIIENDQLLGQKIEKRGWWGRRSSSSKCSSSKFSGTSQRFQVYTCPLDLFKGKKCGRKRGWFGWYTPYGVKHTYIQIGNTCYDWGDWNYPRQVRCDSSTVSCCTSRSTLKHTGTTSCASRIGEFENAWRARGRSYHLLTWNCQKYTDSMKDFLSKCCASPGDAIKSKKRR